MAAHRRFSAISSRRACWGCRNNWGERAMANDRAGDTTTQSIGQTEDEILYALADGVATITLNRPDKLNSLNDSMLQTLPRLLARAADEARAILITGAGRAFCSGAALSGDRLNIAEPK